jgi:hypothetical protein
METVQSLKTVTVNDKQYVFGKKIVDVTSEFKVALSLNDLVTSNELTNPDIDYMITIGSNIPGGFTNMNLPDNIKSDMRSIVGSLNDPRGTITCKLKYIPSLACMKEMDMYEFEFWALGSNPTDEDVYYKKYLLNYQAQNSKEVQST